ncbi:MAG TPA: hypothetical protein VKB25_05205 [Conexibacter sp.]|nr:hypothetical protein [Conexibacter sp.]
MTAVGAPTVGAGQIQTWGDDPGAPDAPHLLIARPRPRLGAAPLPTQITEPEPAAGADLSPGTPGFRYWVAAEALRRGSDLWGATIGAGARWHAAVGAVLPVELDAGPDLNAFYDRQALRFFHDEVAGITCFSGASGDVINHEQGHAVLDALCPQLFDTPFIEAAALHESFGDMSAMLCALQLESIRTAVIEETGGRVGTNSTLSRCAEQLGWAIRRLVPDAVDGDSLRNAANSWFYRDPAQLSPSGPAFQLSSEPHSFSRVFSGAFLGAIGGMFALHGDPTATGLEVVSRDAAQLLRTGVATSPVVPAYMSQVAAHMVAADAQLFQGRYRRALLGAFLGHGILSLPSVDAVSPAVVGRKMAAAGGELEPPQTDLQRVTLPRDAFGLRGDLVVETPVQQRRFGVAGALPDVGSAAIPAPEHAAASFVEDLFRRGRVDIGDAGEEDAPLVRSGRPKSHELQPLDGDGFALVRRHFDCGFHAG